MDENQTQPYRPISKLALGALGIALLGLLALPVDALIAVPVTAAVLAILALYRIRKSGDLAGAGLACVALALSVFTTANWLGQVAMHRALIQQRAQENAEQWLELVAGDRLFEAHQLMKPENDRQAENANLQYHYRVIPEEALASIAPIGEVYPLNDLKLTFEGPPLKQVAAALQGGDKPVLVKSLGVVYSQHHAVVDLQYRLEQDGREFTVSMRRERDRVNRETSWQVLTVAEVPED